MNNCLGYSLIALLAVNIFVGSFQLLTIYEINGRIQRVNQKVNSVVETLGDFYRIAGPTGLLTKAAVVSKRGKQIYQNLRDKFPELSWPTEEEKDPPEKEKKEHSFIENFYKS